jgi:aspartyl-tRNA(Asn)/glutamyl-tRNA(Gln) amidotransferase subunit A
MDAVRYSRGRYQQLALNRAFARLFRQVDLLLTPSAPVAAPLIPGETPSVIYSSTLLRNAAPFNLTGGPAISIPCGFSSEGLPIGLQLAGPDWDESLVLRAAHAYQEATDWHEQRPPLD